MRFFVWGGIICMCWMTLVCGGMDVPSLLANELCCGDAVLLVYSVQGTRTGRRNTSPFCACHGAVPIPASSAAAGCTRSRDEHPGGCHAQKWSPNSMSHSLGAIAECTSSYPMNTYTHTTHQSSRASLSRLILSCSSLRRLSALRCMRATSIHTSPLQTAQV